MKPITKEQVIEILKKRQGDRSAKALAEELGVSPAYLSDVYAGNRDPGPSILEHLGLEKQEIPSVYVPASE